MSKPIIRNGKFSAGGDFQCGENVVVEVAEEVVIGDRCVIADNTYFGGRRVEIGSDFYGYSWEWKRLDIGRGRIDEEGAILTVGSRCTFHDVRIDLARRVTIGDDVGLSPEVAIYTHGYWLSPLDGFPCKYASVDICQGAIIGFRSVLLPGCKIGARCIIGAQSVVTGFLEADGTYAGSPARYIGKVEPLTLNQRESILRNLIAEYTNACDYRGISFGCSWDYPTIYVDGCRLDVEKLTVEGEETELTDDLRWFLFTHGIRIYTQRPFRKLGRK